MKQILTLAAFIAAIAFTSCGHKAQMEAASNTNDSLQMVVNTKDSILNDAFGSIEEISTALSQISEREKIVASTSAGEINKTTKERISENISAISDLLQQNRQAISRLASSAKKLKEANVKIAALESLVASLQQQLEDKDAQISEMSKNLENLKIEIAELKGLNETLSGKNTQLEGTVAEQTTEINTVFWTVGQEKALVKAGVIDKKGFIGRTSVLKDVSNMDNFTKGDLREIERIPIGKKGVKVVSSHPQDSYVLIAGDKNITEELVISDKNSFWKTSKVLVVSYRQ
ncbi:MAG: YbgF trimerization domain-containing protein [Mucinivorans sp.]